MRVDEGAFVRAAGLVACDTSVRIVAGTRVTWFKRQPSTPGEEVPGATATQPARGSAQP